MALALARLTRSLPDPILRAPRPPKATDDAMSDESEWQELSANGGTTAVLTLRGISQLAPFGALVLVPLLTGGLAPGNSACLCLLFATAGAILPGLCLAELISSLPWAGATGGAIFAVARPILGDLPALAIAWGLVGDLLVRLALVAKSVGHVADLFFNGMVAGFVRTYGFNASTFRIAELPPTPLMTGPDLLGLLFALLLSCLFASLLVLGVASRLSLFLGVVFAAGFVVIACTSVLRSVGSGVPLPPAPANSTLSPGGPGPPSLPAILHGTSVALAGYALVDGMSATAGFDGRAESVRLGAASPPHTAPASTFLAVAVNTITFLLGVLGLSGSPLAVHQPGTAYSTLPPLMGHAWLRGYADLLSLVGLAASFFASMDTLAHCIEAMAVEGLLPRRAFASGGAGVVLSAAAVGIIALLGNDAALLHLAAAGTALSLVAAPTCLLVLRYLPSDRLVGLLRTHMPEGGDGCSGGSMASSEEAAAEEWRRYGVRLRPCLRSWDFLESTLARSPRALLVVMVVAAVAMVTCVGLGSVYAVETTGVVWPALGVVGLCAVAAGVLLGCFEPVPLQKMRESFAVPLQPLLPLMGAAIALYLAFNLPWVAWVREAIFFLVGLVIYGGDKLYQYLYAQREKEKEDEDELLREDQSEF